LSRMGETVPNAVLYGVAIAGFSHEDRKGYRWLSYFFDMFKKDFGKVGI